MDGEFLKTNKVHREAQLAMVRVLKRYKNRLSSDELLAISANLTGQLAAIFGDEGVLTASEIADFVDTNLQMGAAMHQSSEAQQHGALS